MAASKIEWTEETWNPIAGCSILSPGCHNCYAMRMAGRLEAMGQKKYAGTTKDGRWTGRINFEEAALSIPLRKKKPTTWFVNSMSDLFHADVPFEFIDRVFAVMALCPQHTFQVLTKRAARMAEWSARFDLPIVPLSLGRQPDDVFEAKWPLPNVWLGVSCEDQKRADERIPHLLRCPAKVRFLSCEPLLGPVELRRWTLDGWLESCEETVDGDDEFSCVGCPGYGPDCRGVWNRPIHQVIVGGESGPGARPVHPDWVRSIRDQCQAAGVKYFFKQWGEWLPHSQSQYVGAHFSVQRHKFDDDNLASRVGKKAAGRLLDGREWNEMPEVSHA